MENIEKIVQRQIPKDYVFSLTNILPKMEIISHYQWISLEDSESHYNFFFSVWLKPFKHVVSLFTFENTFVKQNSHTNTA